jgi:hypothetical protein
VKYHIEEVQVPRRSGGPGSDALDLGEGRRIVHVVSQVPAEDGGPDVLHVLVEDDGTGGDPRGYDSPAGGANMAAVQPAPGPEAQQYPDYPEARNEPEQSPSGPAEGDPAWTDPDSSYEPPDERVDPEHGTPADPEAPDGGDASQGEPDAGEDPGTRGRRGRGF